MTRIETRTISTGAVELQVEAFGPPDGAPVLLTAGMSASMLWWDAAWCRSLAAAGRRVIRFDQRDTGRSTTWPRGVPDYSTGDLVDDAAAVLDGLEIASAHVIGHSMGSGVALGLAVDHPDRVRSLVLAGSTTGDASLPEGSAAFPEPPEDLDDRDALIDHLVADTMSTDATSDWIDPSAIRLLAEADVDRASDMGATLLNHARMRFTAPRAGGFEAVGVPTLVLHGERDALFPVAHGRAVADAIPGAELVVLSGAGHTLQSANADELMAALRRHLDAVVG